MPGMGKQFDPERAVEQYRRAILRLESEDELPADEKAQLRAVAQRLRQEWKETNGDDELHQTAFGEPSDE
jgi:hypothetical protein